MPTQQPRHLALDLLRGLAAVGVVFYHWLDWRYGIRLLSLGTFGIYLFFVLSALAMSMAYGATFRESVTLPSVRDFFRNRAARLLPLLAVASLAVLVLNWLVGGHDVAVGLLDEAVLTASGLMALTPPGYSSVLVGGWSLGIELAFYAIVPILLLMLGNASIRAHAIALAVLVAGQQIYLYSLSSIEDPMRHWQLYSMPLTFAPFFMAGFLVYRIGGTRRAAFLAPMLACITVVAIFSLIWPADLFRSNLAFFAASIPCLLAVYFAHRTALPTFIERPAKWIGDLSYSLYLLHPIAFSISTILRSKLGLPAWTGGVMDLTGAAIAATLSFMLFERPLRDRLRAP